jgi:hypothetical protein
MRSRTTSTITRTLIAGGVAIGLTASATTPVAAQTPSYHIVTTHQLAGDGGWAHAPTASWWWTLSRAKCSVR